MNKIKLFSFLATAIIVTFLDHGTKIARNCNLQPPVTMVVLQSCYRAILLICAIFDILSNF